MRLAAYLGDPDAQTVYCAIGPDGAEDAPVWTPFCRSHDELRTWLDGLPECEPATHRAPWVAARAWLALFRATLLPRVEHWRERDRLEEAAQLLVPLLEQTSRAQGDEGLRRAVASTGSELLRHSPAGWLAYVGRLHLVGLVQLYGSRRPCRAQWRHVIVDADRPPAEASRRAAIRFSVGEGRIRNLLRAELVPLLLT